MDKKKLQEFLNKVKAQTALSDADGGVQPLSESGAEENFEGEVIERNEQAIIANAAEYRDNYKFKNKFIETFEVTEEGVSGGGAKYLDEKTDVGVIVDYDALVHTCMLDFLEITSCKLSLCAQTRANRKLSLFPLDSSVKICDVEQLGGFYIVDLLTVKEATGSYDFRLGKADLMDVLEPDNFSLIINDGLMTFNDFIIRKDIDAEDKNYQAIVDNAVEYKNSYLGRSSFVSFFNVDENRAYDDGEYFIDFDTDLGVLVDYEELIYAYGLKPSAVSSCKLILCGRTKAAHKCNVYPLASAEKFCEITQEGNEYKIDLKALNRMNRADFRLGDPNLMDSLDMSKAKIVINGDDAVDITDFSIAAAGGEAKNANAILNSAKNFRASYDLKDGYIKLFNTNGSEIYAENDFLTANETYDLIGILDYKKLLFSLGYRLADVRSCVLMLHGRVPESSIFNVYSLDTRKRAAQVIKHPHTYEIAVDLKAIYETFGSADFILEMTEFVESFQLSIARLLINGNAYSLLGLYGGDKGYKDGETPYKNLSLAGGAELSLKLNSGSAAVAFGSVNADDFIIPVTVSHVHADGNGDNGCGHNWRLNLDRKLTVSDEDTEETTVYTFTDGTGENHTFTETYYYTENGQKHFIDKNAVTVDINGNLTYGDKEVKKQQSCGGYTLIPEINDYIDSEFIDQRLSEQAELEDYVNSYERSLKEYVKVNSKNGEIIYAMPALNKSGYRQLISGVTQSSETCVMTESEALQLQSLYANKEQLTKQAAQIEFQQSQIALQKKQLELQNKQINQQISDLEHTKIFNQKKHTDWSVSADFVNQSAEEFFAGYELPSEQETTEQGDGGGRDGSSGGGGGGGGTRTRSNESSDSDISDAEYINEFQDKMTYKSAVKNLNLLNSDTGSDIDQKKLAAEQLVLITRQETILAEQAVTLTEQTGFVNAQINYMLSQARNNLASIKDAFKKYFNKKAQLEYTLLHTPVNYLKDGNGLISGFSKAGDLVCIFDTYGNSVAVEYDKSSRITGLHDSNGKAVSFKYSGGKLESITDTRGRTVKYGYDGENLISVEFADGATLNFAYDGEKLVSAISDGIVCGQVTYDKDKVMAVKTLSKPLTIEKNMTESEESDFTEVLSSVEVEYDAEVKVNYNGEVKETIIHGATLAYPDGSSEEYRFVGGKLHSVAQTDNLGFKTHTKYTSYGKRGDAVVTLTRGTATENEIIYKVYNKETEKLLAEYNLATMTENYAFKTKKTYAYTYDEDDRLISETSEKITIINGEEEKRSAAVTYHYNASGNLILTESKILGEEQTSGVNFTERTYDKNGNVTKTVSWNSLDASTKFYTQSDVAENGQVTAERDETGEISAEYEYVEGTNVVNTVTQANGSKLSYGRNPYNLSVTSVTQSTADGEANTTDIVYEHGLPVEVTSGGTVINYAYDCHGRKTSVAVNGALQSQYVYSDYEYNEETGKTLFEAATATKYVNDTETVTCYSEKTAVTDEAAGRKKVTEAYNINGEEVLVKNYDANNNLTDISDFKAGTFTEFTYDGQNRLTSVEAVKNGSTCLTESYTYSDSGELTSKYIEAGLAPLYAYTYRDNAARTLDKIEVAGLQFKPLTDVYGRNTGKEVFNAGNKLCGEYISYRKVGDHGTNTPATVWFANGTNIKENLRYKYDSYGNIAQITRNGDKIISYEYDSLNRLARENNKPLNKTVLYSYDTNGNILSRCEYAYTVKDNEELSELTCKHFDYIYEGDRLIKILSSDGEEQFAYNNLGSPTTYRNAQLQWQYGRLLTKYGETTFEYDGLGRRTKKGDISYLYDSEGKLQYSSDGVQYLYDDKGVVGFVEDGGVGIMLYRKDAQGNIIALLDSAGAVVVRYEYDAWGNHKVLDANGQAITDPGHIGHKNPFRYRGYFYDEETRLYYLQTRYYDPITGRFISQDGIDYADPQTPNGINLYAYCANNPVMGYDPNGTINWKKLFGWIVAVYVTAVTVIAGVALTVLSFGAASPLLGLGLAVAGGALLGFAGAFTSNIATQTKSVGWDNVNFWEATKVGAIGAVAGAISGLFSFSIGQAAKIVGNVLGFTLSKMSIGGLEVSKVFSSSLMAGVFGVGGSVLGGIIGSIVGDYYGNSVTNQEYDRSSLVDTFRNIAFNNIIEFVTWILGITI